jgi:RNA polymerase sigma-70 factor (ECF subfamily)
VDRKRAASGRVRLEVIAGGRGAADSPAETTHDTSSDVDWVLRAREGDVAAQEYLFRRFLGSLRQRVYRLLGPDAEVDDVVQEAFMRAFEGLSKLAEPRAFPAWLSTIAIHLVDRRLRRRKLARRLGFVSIDITESASDTVASSNVSPAVAAEARVVYRILDRLPTEARVAFLLRRLEGMTVPEVAAQMGLSERTVKRRIVLCEQKLAAVFDNDISGGGAGEGGEG